MDRRHRSQAGSARTRLDQLRLRLDPLWRRIRARFEVDTRSLAAVRILLALTLLGDLLYRTTNLEQFYTDAGVYPLSAFEVTYTQYNWLTLHALSGDLWFQQLLFLGAGVVALAFLVGYRTRLVGALSLLLLFSLHGRNPGVLNGGDQLFRVLLLVALATPLGERWSIDALRRGTARSSVASFGTAALLVQPLVVFTANAVLKHAGDHWYAGEALEIALANDVMTILLGDVIATYSGLLTVLNYAWVILLAGSVLFLLVPVGRIRALAALAYISAFAGMLVTMSVGVFPYALTASVVPYLTAPFWDSIEERLPESWTAAWRDRLPTAAALGPLNRPPLERRLLDRLRKRGHESAASFAVSYAQSLLTIIGVLLLAWMLMFGAADVTEYDVPDEIDYQALDQQSWGLYAPDPTDSFSWYVVEAEVGSETVIADLEGTADSFDGPPDAATSYSTFRHRKYMQKVRASGEDDDFTETIAEAYARWACTQIAANHDKRVDELTVYQVYQQSPVDGEVDTPHKDRVIEWECETTH